MKAMIFAAGLGTRLRPLTNNLPKALIEINGKTLLEITINRLIENGFNEIIVNVHHHGNQIISFLREHKFKTKIEISDERDKLLDTGGGLKKAMWFFDEKPFLLHNVDIISDLNLNELYEIHKKNSSIATLAVRKRKSLRYFLFDNKMILCGWENVKTNERKLTKEVNETAPFAFSGIHIIDPKLFKYFPKSDKFSIIDVYLNAAQMEIIKGYQHNYSLWEDVGRLEDLKNLERLS